jgi:hypothetical protein
MQWQCVEERLGTSTTPDRQFVWGLRGLDDLMLRDRTTTNPLDERRYACPDANANVTAIVDDAGAVTERYEYTPYGVTTVLAPNFTPRTTSTADWETTYAGYRHDATDRPLPRPPPVLPPAVGDVAHPRPHRLQRRLSQLAGVRRFATAGRD